MTGITRRSFLGRSGAGIAATATLPALTTGPQQKAAAQQPGPAPRTRIALTVNGETHSLEVEDRWTLVEVLRDHLELTGTRIGCDRGECGACTVLLDGKNIFACSYLAVWADGKAVETVEGLARNGVLDPLQEAFIAHDAPQCGFCTSGQLMSAKALLSEGTEVTEANVREALAGNICRCSNFLNYQAAVARGEPGHPAAADPLRVVGRPTPRLDALERVTGQARYSPDIRLPGMLYARILRSPHPHALIRAIDVQAALDLDGVAAVLTHENCDIDWASGDLANRRMLFNNPVRYYGDAVAAVAATDRHTAEAAAQLIEVDYDTLPFVLDAEEALEPDAVPIQPGGNLAPPFGALRGGGAAVPGPAVYERGDVETGLAESDVVIEDHYVSKHHNNAQMEPRTAVAEWESGKLTIWTPTQGITNCRDDIAAAFGLPNEQVRVICEYMGGGFGNKNQCQDTDLIAAELARRTERPVKLELTRKEDFLSIHGRWPTSQYYRVGAKRDGTLHAIELRGYSGMGPHIKSSGDIAGIDFYQCPNVSKAVHTVHTNVTTSANYRAPSYPQGVFGIASVLDRICDEIDMDPLDFHLKNATRRYRDATPYTSYGLIDCIEQGAEAFDWRNRRRPVEADAGPIKRGTGMAIGAFTARLGLSNAVLRLDDAGTLWLHAGVTDIGTGAKTTLAMIAAEAMEMDLDQVEIVWGDTDRSPYSVGESGSRTTSHTGYAIVEAAEDLKRQLAERGPPGPGEELVAEASPNPSLDGEQRYSFAAHFVELEVDTELGGVQLTKYVAAHDSGRIVNPLTATSQVKGGVIQGIGMALHEELLYDRNTGIPVNPGYYGARIMTHLDTVPIDVVFVETQDAHGPMGAKSIGESTIIPVVGAIANAIFNATGKRIKELPISRDRVIGAMS